VHLEFLVEEFSTQECLNQILPKILFENVTYKIHAFRGKSDLIKKLPERLKGYKCWITDDYRIIILVDRDNEDCQKIKEKLENIAQQTGLITKTISEDKKTFQVLNRIAIEELEAWFFGDISAIVAAYPRVSPNLGQQEKYRDADAIRGGTWENLEKVLQRAGHHKGGLEKLRAAREISQYMEPHLNRSRSFQVFYNGLLDIIS
jgi:hypothetical protein